MYLEGIGGNRNYTLAEHFFSNLTDPAFNTSYHLFGQGLLRFYGLGMERNISRGCDFIREASALTVGVPVFRSVFVGGVRSSYYNGLVLPEEAPVQVCTRLLHPVSIRAIRALD